MRIIRISIAILLAATLSGCGDFAAVRLGSLSKPGTGRLVFGLDSSGGPLDVAFERYGLGRSCDPLPEGKVVKGAKTIEYFAFDVPPGTYVLSRSTLAVLNEKGDPGFFVAAGHQDFVGTFRLGKPLPGQPEAGLQEMMAQQHDLNVATAALGPSVGTLELAAVGPTDGLRMACYL